MQTQKQTKRKKATPLQATPEEKTMFSKKEEIPADLEYFTIFDTKVGHYKTPMLVINKHEMFRELERFMRNPENKTDPLYTNAEDFQLFSVGNFTKKTGLINSWKPEHVANLHEIKSLVMRDQPKTWEERTIEDLEKGRRAKVLLD